jgi:hypothetical protein
MPCGKNTLRTFRESSTRMYSFASPDGIGSHASLTMISFGPTCDSPNVTPPTSSVRSTSADQGVIVDMADELDLILRAETYAKNNRRRIVRKARLGGGTDGEVWRSTRPSAIKVVLNSRNYRDELESYQRLKAADIHRLCGFNIPRLLGGNVVSIAHIEKGSPCLVEVLC